MSQEGVKFPYSIKRVDDDINKKLMNYFKGERSGFIEVGPQKWILLSGFEKDLEQFYNFKARSEDVWVVSFPRAGSTVLQELVWLLANNMEFDKAKTLSLHRDRFPFFEFLSTVHKDIVEETKQTRIQTDLEESPLKKLDAMKGRRFIKTHLPLSLLPKNIFEVGAKVIYIARNPKNIAISYYHLNRMLKYLNYVGDFNTFWELFENNLVYRAPYWEHVKEAWENQNKENLIFLFYEDLLKNKRPTIQKLSQFFSVNYSENQIDKLVDHLDIDNFRKNTAINFTLKNEMGFVLDGEEDFIRKGKTGEFEEYFNEELTERADKWIEYHEKKLDIKFSMK